MATQIVEIPKSIIEMTSKQLQQQPMVEKESAVVEKEKQKRRQGIYTQNILVRKVFLDISEIGGNIAANLERKLRREIEGKCIKEGYIKLNSIKIITYSSGVLKANRVEFTVSFECLICCPVEGMKIFKCVAKNITKAGIRAELRTEGEEPSPIVVFIARDHHYDNKYFATIKEDDEINIRVIGQRYELNDTYISIIAELIEPKEKSVAVTFTLPSTSSEKKTSENGKGEKKKLKLVISE